MKDVQFGDLVGRMVISLVVVLGLLYVAYRVMKSRQGRSFGGSTRQVRPAAGRPSLLGRRTPRASQGKRGLAIVSRVGLSRSTGVVAVQFGERVLMLGTSEQTPPAVLAEMTLDAWNASTEEVDALVPMNQPAIVRGAPRPTLLQALRDATVRHG